MNFPIRTYSIWKQFRGTTVLEDLCLNVPEGSIYGLVGPSGAGKTTAIKLLMNILRPSAGWSEVFGVNSHRLSPREFAQWSIEPTRRIVAGVRRQVPGAKIIGFPRGAGALLPSYIEATGVDAVSIDWAAEPSLIRDKVQNRVAVQGNLDPLALIAGGAALDRAVDDVLTNFAGGRLIFNLGHGIQPETPIPHVEQMIRRVRGNGIRN